MIEGHGDDSYKYSRAITADFSSNIAPYVDLAPLEEYLCGCMGGIGNYPEPEPYGLETLIATRHGLHVDEVTVTNGATEAIYLIAQTFRDRRSLVLQPTFSEYADACRINGHKVSALYQLPGAPQGHRLPADTDLCWLCNPNNPTGGVIDKAVLTEIVACNPQVCFVIDHSYEDFTMSPLLSVKEAAAFPNVLLLHSLTKRYAIPGLRVGYVTGNAPLLVRLRAHRMPWSVNRLAIEAGCYLLERGLPRLVDLGRYLQETARLAARLKALGGMDVWDTHTHFMLVRLRVGKASALKAYLVREHGMLIRDASNFEGLDDRFFRITTRRPDENDRLVDAIAVFFRDAL
ncbi:MAG: pyridoxal phosphate-dependent class II aminotransferase [Prevotellaceae bacterium]|nr:pyridoxal phosphate-dependent class II aminotransferase [Prevotellaceae bacterium]